MTSSDAVDQSQSVNILDDKWSHMVSIELLGSRISHGI